MWKLNVLLTNISDKKSQEKLENILRQIEIKTQDTKLMGCIQIKGEFIAITYILRNISNQ